MDIKAINFTQIILDLEAQFSHQKISDFVDCSKGNISALKRGTQPNHHLGQKLLQLHSVHCPDPDLKKAG
jgi:hypothetical protein